MITTEYQYVLIAVSGHGRGGDRQHVQHVGAVRAAGPPAVEPAGRPAV